MSDRNATLWGWVVGKLKAGGFASSSKTALHSAVEGLKGGAHGAAGGAGTAGANGVAAASSNALFGVAMMGGIGVISVISNQIEYMEGREQIKEFYKEELAAKNHKAEKDVADADVTKAEASNATIKQAVGRERSFRNLGIGASFVASIAVLGLMEVVFPGSHAIAFTAEALLPLAAKVAVGALTYLATKAPLMKIGKAVFGLNEPTTHDLIVDIARDRERGKSITREQVVEVFISGNKQLSDFVEQSYGTEYKNLALSDKVKVANKLAELLPIDKIANNINLGTAMASELAYTVQGDVSGVLPKQADRERDPSAFERFTQRCKSMMHGVTHMFSSEKAHPIETKTTTHEAKKPHAPQHVEPESPIVELNQGPSHVERLGRSKQDHHKGHVEQLAERNAQQVMMPGSPTIQ